MVSETSPEGVQRYLGTCTRRGRVREVEGEGAGRGDTGEVDREGETGDEGRTSVAVDLKKSNS